MPVHLVHFKRLCSDSVQRCLSDLMLLCLNNGSNFSNVEENKSEDMLHSNVTVVCVISLWLYSVQSVAKTLTDLNLIYRMYCRFFVLSKWRHSPLNKSETYSYRQNLKLIHLLLKSSSELESSAESTGWVKTGTMGSNYDAQQFTSYCVPGN